MDYKFAHRQNLELIYSLLIDNKTEFKEEMIWMINNPEEIYNTNNFVSILSELKIEAFIEPLLEQINSCEGTEQWLTDYLYAAINLIEDSSEDFHSPDGLTDKLGDWLLNEHKKGELAWKAAELLKFSESEAAERYMVEKFKDKDAFVLTRIACLRGIARHSFNRNIELIHEALNDEEKEIREASRKLINHYG